VTIAQTIIDAARLAPESKKLREHAALLERVPESRRELVAAAIAVLTPQYTSVFGGGGFIVDVARALEGAPYPSAPEAIRARVVLGESPSEISRGLTRAEAHRWLTEWPSLSPALWLLSDYEDLAAVGILDAPHDVACARWLIAVFSDPPRRSAMLREREERVAGQVVRGRYADRTDELRASDLRPSVEDTYRAAAQRVSAEHLRLLERASKGERLAPVPRWWRPMRCARLLDTVGLLRLEGREMEHCVGSYAAAVHKQESVIVALDVCGHRSTAELSRDGKTCRQHKAKGNRAPNVLCTRALWVLMSRCTDGAGSGPEPRE